MILSHSVMHAEFDPTRKPMLQAFLRSLGEPTKIVCDTNRDGIYKTAWRAWEAHEPSSDWHIVMQDDMHPVPGAMSRIREILSTSPQDRIVSFFQPALGYENTLYHYVKPWLDHGDGLIEFTGPSILWGGSIAVPTKFVPRMVDEIRRFMPREIWNEADDEKICFWARKMGLKRFAYAPSLMEHVGWTRSVYKGLAHEPWKRGMIIHGEAESRRSEWQDALADLDKRKHMMYGHMVFFEDTSALQYKTSLDRQDMVIP